MGKNYGWNELLVIAGVNVIYDEDKKRFFVKGSKSNQEFLERILFEATKKERKINLAIKNLAPSLSEWLAALEKVGGKPTGQLYRMHEIKLEEIDIYMLGLIRQLNIRGLMTDCSCSGHGTRKPFLSFKEISDARNANVLFGKLNITSRFSGSKTLEIDLEEPDLIELALKLNHLNQCEIKAIEEINLNSKLEILDDLLRIPGRSGEENQVRDYIINKLSKIGVQYKVDHYGNILVDEVFGDGNTVLLSAHMDVVDSDINPDAEIIKIDGIWKRESGILGADDRAGLAMILNILEELKRNHFRGKLKIAFTVEEETGRNGAQNIDKAFFHGVDFALSFDRRNSSDIVTHSANYKYCSEEFGKYLENISRNKYDGQNRYKCTMGGISDLTVWSSLGIESVNLSVGYYNEHTANEYLNIFEWKRTHHFAISVIQSLSIKDGGGRENLYSGEGTLKFRKRIEST